MQKRPTMRELADQALLTQTDIVKKSNLSVNTVASILRGEEVKRITLLRALAVINRKLGTDYTLKTVDAPYK